MTSDGLYNYAYDAENHQTTTAGVAYITFALDKEQIKPCRMQIDYVHLPESYRE